MSARGWRERELTVSTRGKLGSLQVVVEDSGPGIPKALQLRVFEPFFTTKREGRRHMGTGLASAQQVAADHGGSIEIDAAVTSGCRISVTLPVKRGS